MQLSCYIHRNPLRTGIVKRLVDYTWSSYPIYAYGKEHPKWLNLDVILSQFGTKERHRLFREKAARILDCNLIDYRRSLRISGQYRDKRDLLIYLLWEIGLYKNQEIGDLLGLTYSSISRRANITRARISKDIKFKKQFKQLKSQIKM